MHYLIPLLLVFVSATSWSGVLPNSTREQLLKNSLAIFWGRAKLRDDSFVQPANEQELLAIASATSALVRTRTLEHESLAVAHNK